MKKLYAALITPLTGPLSLFGGTCATALTLWAEQVRDLPSPWGGIELDIRDAGSDVGAAIRAAQDAQPDVLFGPYGSGPMIRAARVSERLLWNHGGASSRLAKPTFSRVINVLSPATTYFASVLQAIHAFDRAARAVSLFHSTTGFGWDVATGAKQETTRLQMTLQSVTFEASHALGAVDGVPDGDILLVAGNFADERAVAPVLLSRKWKFAAFVGAGVEEVLAPLGDLREGLIGPAQWVAHPSLKPDEGPDAQWFVRHYRKVDGSDPPYPAAQAFAAGILYARCLRETEETRDEVIQAVAQKLVCQTLFGKFQLDPKTGLQIGHQVVIVQWQHDQQRVVWPPEQAECSLVFSSPK